MKKSGGFTGAVGLLTGRADWGVLTSAQGHFLKLLRWEEGAEKVTVAALLHRGGRNSRGPHLKTASCRPATVIPTHWHHRHGDGEQADPWQPPLPRQQDQLVCRLFIKLHRQNNRPASEASFFQEMTFLSPPAGRHHMTNNSTLISASWSSMNEALIELERQERFCRNGGREGRKGPPRPSGVSQQGRVDRRRG